MLFKYRADDLDRLPQPTDTVFVDTWRLKGCCSGVDGGAGTFVFAMSTALVLTGGSR